MGRMRELSLVLASACIFIVMMGIAQVIYQNHQRSSQFDEERIAQCKSIYRGIDSVFVIFFPPTKKWTEEQATTYDKFFNRTRLLRERCDD